MTEIAGVGAANAGLIRAAVQNEEQQLNQQQAQNNQDPTAVAARRVEQAQGGSGDNGVGNPGNQNFDFSADDVQQEQVNAQVDLSLEREENTQVQLQDENLRANDSVEISLSNAAQQSQNNINQQAVQDVESAKRSQQVGIAQTDSSIASDEFTRALDDKRELDDASNGESRGARELGRVLDTFA
tara:strand:+ start:89 stop:643 length:555 start_codon:yes stop_codon:yes gene_type:complete